MQACKCASDGPPGTPGGPFPCAEWQWGALGTRADLTLYIPPHPLRSFYFTSITVFTKSPYTYTSNQKTDKKTIEQSVELFDMKDFDIEIKKNAE